ncbi:Serine/threonine-protein kinase TOR [Camellia lanceoleosa]|uniref:Serine/threonine-protein kinase TOR n=1 Tax=Camellia lanceoleosa TaxID=1840588 RepID=A0ACC0I7X5_9ERIC|nr:Serine/threonine-protein kinase TOR [Camellia lanceoleosa]
MDYSNSATQRPSDSSTKKKDKKRSRANDEVVEGLTMFADKLVDVLGTTNDKLEFIGKRMGYSHDLASKRASLNDELTKLPITVDERLDACEIISHDVQKLDMFFSLTHDDRLRHNLSMHIVLGHLARFSGAMTADEMEWHVKNALEWLHGERVEYRRFAAVLILKEMAENASTVFNVHVPEFVDAIWVALRDPTLAV